MKEKLYLEYGYKIDYLTYKKDYIYFEYNDSKYFIYKTIFTEEQLSKLNQIVNHLDNYAIFFHQLIPNKQGFKFEFANDTYVLIKPRIISERPITLNEIIKVSNVPVENFNYNIIETKIDFIEQYLANYESLELENINYFIGLAENSITLFNLTNSSSKIYLNHRRIHYNEKAFDFYNPLNIVIDYRSRDLAEYAKSLFLFGNNKLIEFLKYFDYNDWYTYFARVLYPSFYFDLVDNYINKSIKFDKKRINYLANSFEQALRELYIYISSNINMPDIEWLRNINNF